MNRTLAMEFLVSIGIVSWAPIKNGKLPWPPSYIHVGVSFALLSFVSLVDQRIANLLGGGFILAQLLGALSTNANLPGYIYDNLIKDGWFQNYALSTTGKVGG